MLLLYKPDEKIIFFKKTHLFILVQGKGTIFLQVSLDSVLLNLELSMSSFKFSVFGNINGANLSSLI